jgi:hypothetical protein
MNRESFLTAGALSLDLISSPQVREAWDEESACADMSVGALAHHLAHQAVSTVRVLRLDVPDPEPIPLLDHYARAAWVEASHDDEANTSIRDESEDAAAGGPETVLRDLRDALDALPDLLAAPRNPDVVDIPWQAWCLTTDDFLTTRLMELVVHSDDLAASVGLETPQFPDDVVASVLALLSGVAVRRHGQTAVVRALSRPQRAPASISAF